MICTKYNDLYIVWQIMHRFTQSLEIWKNVLNSQPGTSIAFTTMLWQISIHMNFSIFFNHTMHLSYFLHRCPEIVLWMSWMLLKMIDIYFTKKKTFCGIEIIMIPQWLCCARGPLSHVQFFYHARFVLDSDVWLSILALLKIYSFMPWNYLSVMSLCIVRADALSGYWERRCTRCYAPNAQTYPHSCSMPLISRCTVTLCLNPWTDIPTTTEWLPQ